MATAAVSHRTAYKLQWEVACGQPGRTLGAARLAEGTRRACFCRTITRSRGILPASPRYPDHNTKRRIAPHWASRQHEQGPETRPAGQSRERLGGGRGRDRRHALRRDPTGWVPNGPARRPTDPHLERGGMGLVGRGLPNTVTRDALGGTLAAGTRACRRRLNRMRQWSIVGSVGWLHGPGRQRSHASVGQPGRPAG